MRWWPGALDFKESFDSLRGEFCQTHFEVGFPIRQMLRIVRDEARSGEAGLTADGVQHVGREGEMEHLFDYNCANDVVGIKVGLRVVRLNRVEGRQVRRDRRVLQLDRDLEV